MTGSITRHTPRVRPSGQGTENVTTTPWSCLQEVRATHSISFLEDEGLGDLGPRLKSYPALFCLPGSAEFLESVGEQVEACAGQVVGSGGHGFPEQWA